MEEHPERVENWKSFSDMCSEITSQAHRKADTYKWVIGGICGALLFVLGLYIQSERYTKTIFVLDTRVTVLEKQFAGLEAKLDKIAERMATKEDIERIAK